MAKWLDPFTWKIVRHLLGNVLVVAIVLAAAIGLDVLEHFGKEHHFSPWLLDGIAFLARFLFYADVLFVCCFVTLGIIHMIKEAWGKLSNNHDRRR